MEDARKQHQQDLAERDFTADQTRKKYQSERDSPCQSICLLTIFVMQLSWRS